MKARKRDEGSFKWISGEGILKFTLPVFAGNIFQQLYQMVDNIILGQFVGADAFAAVGATYGIYFLISGFIWGTTSGFTVITAQKYGEGDEEGVRRSVGTAVWLCSVLTVLMTIFSMAGISGLLKLLNTPDDIYTDAYAYIIVICGGLAAQVFIICWPEH